MKEHHRVLCYYLLTQGKLDSHLADVEEQAQTMFERLTEQMAENHGVTEALKARDMMAWVGYMNNIRNAFILKLSAYRMNHKRKPSRKAAPAMIILGGYRNHIPQSRPRFY